jgi:hypothetical protein
MFIIGFCLLWILMCGRIWWQIDRSHPWQRRVMAIGAGVGAGLFYLFGTMLWAIVKPKPEPLQPISGETIRVSPKAPK